MPPYLCVLRRVLQISGGTCAVCSIIGGTFKQWIISGSLSVCLSVFNDPVSQCAQCIGLVTPWCALCTLLSSHWFCLNHTVTSARSSVDGHVKADSVPCICSLAWTGHTWGLMGHANIARVGNCIATHHPPLVFIIYYGHRRHKPSSKRISPSNHHLRQPALSKES
jgi:hypothetical protein